MQCNLPKRKGHGCNPVLVFTKLGIHESEDSDHEFQSYIAYIVFINMIIYFIFKMDGIYKVL